jgi:hypothetical protein
MHKLENHKSSRRRALSDVQGEGPSVALLRALLSRVLTCAHFKKARFRFSR